MATLLALCRSCLLVAAHRSNRRRRAGWSAPPWGAPLRAESSSRTALSRSFPRSRVGMPSATLRVDSATAARRNTRRLIPTARAPQPTILPPRPDQAALPLHHHDPRESTAVAPRRYEFGEPKSLHYVTGTLAAWHRVFTRASVGTSTESLRPDSTCGADGPRPPPRARRRRASQTAFPRRAWERVISSRDRALPDDVRQGSGVCCFTSPRSIAASRGEGSRVPMRQGMLSRPRAALRGDWDQDTFRSLVEAFSTAFV
jgi:hypothetical protein